MYVISIISIYTLGYFEKLKSYSHFSCNSCVYLMNAIVPLRASDRVRRIEREWSERKASYSEGIETNLRLNMDGHSRFHKEREETATLTRLTLCTESFPFFSYLPFKIKFTT